MVDRPSTDGVLIWFGTRAHFTLRAVDLAHVAGQVDGGVSCIAPRTSPAPTPQHRSMKDGLA